MSTDRQVALDLAVHSAENNSTNPRVPIPQLALKPASSDLVT